MSVWLIWTMDYDRHAYKHVKFRLTHVLLPISGSALCTFLMAMCFILWDSFLRCCFYFSFLFYFFLQRENGVWYVQSIAWFSLVDTLRPVVLVHMFFFRNIVLRFGWDVTTFHHKLFLQLGDCCCLSSRLSIVLNWFLVLLFIFSSKRSWSVCI